MVALHCKGHIYDKCSYIGWNKHKKALSKFLNFCKKSSRMEHKGFLNWIISKFDELGKPIWTHFVAFFMLLSPFKNCKNCIFPAEINITELLWEGEEKQLSTVKIQLLAISVIINSG